LDPSAAALGCCTVLLVGWLLLWPLVGCLLLLVLLLSLRRRPALRLLCATLRSSGIVFGAFRRRSSERYRMRRANRATNGGFFFAPLRQRLKISSSTIKKRAKRTKRPTRAKQKARRKKRRSKSAHQQAGAVKQSKAKQNRATVARFRY